MQERAAEQLFKVLGELKGGAMKFGQALSLFEAVLPEEIAAPYRAHLTRLQDAAPPMPTSRVHTVLARELGPRWRDLRPSSTRGRRPRPPSARCTGAIWRDGRPVAVKVQYPGADEALRSDLRQIGRLSKVIAPLAGGMDVKPLVDELTARVGEELDYTLEAGHQQQAAEGFAGHPEFVVPQVLASTSQGDGQRVGRRTPRCPPADDSVEQRNAIGLPLRAVPVRRPAPGRAAARRPASRQLQGAGRRAAGRGRLRAGRPAARRAAVGDGADPAHRRDAATPSRCRPAAVEGFVGDDVDADDLLDYLAPFVEPAAVPEFQFSRDWMREQFIRVRDVQGLRRGRHEAQPAAELPADPPGLARRSGRAVPARTSGPPSVGCWRSSCPATPADSPSRQILWPVRRPQGLTTRRFERVHHRARPSHSRTAWKTRPGKPGPSGSPGPAPSLMLPAPPGRSRRHRLRQRVLARTSPGTLPRHDDAADEQLTAPDTPRLVPFQGAGQAGLLQRAVPAQGLRHFDITRRLGEPEIRVVQSTREGPHIQLRRTRPQE